MTKLINILIAIVFNDSSNFLVLHNMLVFQNSTGHNNILVIKAISSDECNILKYGKYICTQLLQKNFMNSSGISSHSVAVSAL